MKLINKLLLALAVCLIVIGIILSLTAIFLNGGFSGFGSDEAEEIKHTVDGEFDKLSIDASSQDIEILPSESDESYVLIKNEKESHLTYTVEVKDGSLSIFEVFKNEKWYNIFNFSSVHRKITVYLAKTNFDSLVLDLSSGDVKISDKFSFANADIDMSSGDVEFFANVENELKIAGSSGDIEIKGTEAKNIDCETSSGEITIEGVAANKIKCDLTSGDITLKNITSSEISLETTSGDVVMMSVISGKIKCNLTSGDMDFELCDGEEIDISTSSGSVKGSFLSDKIFIADASSGDVRVPSTTSGGVCKINTTSGDITVEIKSE